MTGNTTDGGTGTQVPVGQMTTSDLFTAIQEIEARYMPDEQVRELQPFWDRLQQLATGGGDTG